MNAKDQVLAAIDRLILEAEARRDRFLENELTWGPLMLCDGPLTDLENCVAYVDRLVRFRSAVAVAYGHRNAAMGRGAT